MVISAPTGSGKTVLFELCILRLLSKFVSEEGRFIHLKGTLKAVSVQCSDTIVDIYFNFLDWNFLTPLFHLPCLCTVSNV
jgi:ATP-dependent DNA helicase HFM1/MER3